MHLERQKSIAIKEASEAEEDKESSTGPTSNKSLSSGFGSRETTPTNKLQVFTNAFELTPVQEVAP